MESQKNKNRRIFNLLLFVFAAIVLYIHLSQQNTKKSIEKQEILQEAPQENN